MTNHHSIRLREVQPQPLPADLERVAFWEVLRQVYEDHEGMDQKSILQGFYTVMECFDSGFTPLQAYCAGHLRVLMAERQK